MVSRPSILQSIILGLIEVRTASSTDLLVPRVARSIAQARSQESSILAFDAAIKDCTVCTTFPSAK